MQEVIAGVFQKRLGNLPIKKLLDGAVVFETDCTYDSLNFFCFNNIFALLDILELKNFKGQQPDSGILEFHMRKILETKRPWPLISVNNKKIKSFRLVCSMENTLSPVNEKTKQEMEHFIQANSTLQLSRSKPDTEFWFLYRREGFSFFLKRLTNHRIGEKSLKKGELSPQLAWLLCYIAKLKHNELVLDPCCGYGAIPKAGCRHFPIKKFYASDIDPRCIEITCSKNGLRKEGCEIFQADFHSIHDFIPPGTIDAIVTDPPWGMYKTDVSLQTFYNDMIAVFSKALKDNGRAIILSAAEKELESAVEKEQSFKISGKIPILVSGKKACVFTLVKVIYI
jgi:tRNA G10  N-methylase Trm11